jgi:hypothetical protein
MKDQDCLNANSVKTDNVSMNTKKQYIENDAIDITALIEAFSVLKEILIVSERRRDIVTR